MITIFKRFFISCLFLSAFLTFYAQPLTSWPEQTVYNKPGSRWWWMGSAVDEANLTRSLESFAEAGIGSLEITPIYGVIGNEANDVPFLSERWLELYRHCMKEADRLGLKIDLNTGTGWPFGGPDVSVEDAASKLFITEYHLKRGERLEAKIEVAVPRQKATARLHRLMAFSDRGDVRDLTSKVVNQTLNWKAPRGNWRLIAAFSGNTFQQVKRAAPGGEGLVMNHFSSGAVGRYLSKFSEAFARPGTPVPNMFFNDSYEVYQADWTPDMFEEFEKRRGYKLENYLPQFLSENRDDKASRIVSDYRETIAELLLENFTKQWAAWATNLGSTTRNQAHGSPGNLIDLYAAVGVPECEGFGLSEFNINGLRFDSLTRKNDSDLSMLKYASSAANIAGKPFTSSETFTWLTEHFRTSFAQCKPDLDLMFVSGVNRVYFHGTTYSPTEVAWPGWKFYASVDMSPTNPMWRDIPAFNNYISRVQSFLQMGKPDNDFLVYLPIYDLWHEQPGRLLMFDIHKMAQRAPKFIDVVHQINNAGFSMDYISDNFIRSSVVENGMIKTSGGQHYKALIVPGVRLMPADVLEKLVSMAKQGATIVFVDGYPQDVPGFSLLESRREKFNNIKNLLPAANFNKTVTSRLEKGRVITGNNYAAALKATNVAPELMKTHFRLQHVRRSNSHGHHYFISALIESDTDGWIPLAVQAKSAMLFNPLTGEKGKADVRQIGEKTEVRLQLRSGESIILKTFDNYDVDVCEWSYYKIVDSPIVLNNDWSFYFAESTPAIADTFFMQNISPWTDLENPLVRVNMGTGVYTKTFNFDKREADNWFLDLGDVRESARVTINGSYVATLWAVPYKIAVGEYLRNGINTIKIEVTSLPANRIAELDRQGFEWRIFKDINFVDLNYKQTGYGHWEPMPAGLNSGVKLYPALYSNK